MLKGREVVIVEAARTPIGRGHPEKGYYKDVHANELLGRTFTALIERAGIDASEVEDVIGGCVDQIGEQMFNVDAQRLAAGRAADGDAGHDRRPPVRLGPAGGQLRRRADRRRRARRRHRRGRRAHGPRPDRGRLQVGRRGRDAVPARAVRALQPRPAGHLGGDDRRQVGALPLGDGRAGAALAPARGARDGGGPLRARDHPVRGQRRHLRRRPGHPGGREPRAARRAQAGLQARRKGHRGQRLADLRRGRRRAADVGREGARARTDAARADRRSDDRRRGPGDDAHGPDPGHAASCSSAPA